MRTLSYLAVTIGVTSFMLVIGDLNLRPIIGILSQKPSSSMIEGEDKNYTSYIAASYVKFVESSGARVAPIWINQDQEYYQNMVKSVNGILFPGGSSSIHNDSGYGMAGQYIFEEVLKRNAEGYHLPLWGTCLGFEMIAYLSANFVDLRVECDASNIALPLYLTEDSSESSLFSQMPSDILEILTKENVTSNFHIFCLTSEDMELHGLHEDYYFMTENFDRNNFRFLSSYEHKRLPIFGTQWHPEKNSYEWKNSESFDSIPHGYNATYSAQFFGDFFIEEARQNSQSFPNLEEEESSLIYNFDTKYTGNTSSSFLQIYLFEQ